MDFVLAFPHVSIKFGMYIDVTQGIKTKVISSMTHALKILKNIYWQSKRSEVWNKNLSKGIEEIGF